MIFFDGGRGVGKLLHANIFLNAAQFFVCLPLPGSTLFLFAYNLFQCLQPLQTIYSKIFQPHPPPPPHHKDNGLSLRSTLLKSLLNV